MDLIPRQLFTRDCCGNPCIFATDIKDKELQVKIHEWIEMGGGIVENYKKPDSCDCRILLVDPESRFLPKIDDGDVFDANYIKDCVEAKRLLPNVTDYRKNTRTIFEKYDPMEILMGKLKWSDLSRKLSAKIRSPRKGQIVEEENSDIDDEVVLNMPVNIPKENVSAIRNATLKKAVWFNKKLTDYSLLYRVKAV